MKFIDKEKKTINFSAREDIYYCDKIEKKYTDALKHMTEADCESNFLLFIDVFSSVFYK